MAQLYAPGPDQFKDGGVRDPRMKRDQATRPNLKGGKRRGSAASRLWPADYSTAFFTFSATSGVTHLVQMSGSFLMKYFAPSSPVA